MGFRNPFRFTVDPKTGWVLMGDYGPDAGTTERQPRPAGLGRVQRPHQAGQLRLAVLHPRQRPRTTTTTSPPARPGAKFNCAAPVNNSPNNTGLTNLPPAKPAVVWMGYTRPTRATRASAPAAPRWAARATTSTPNLVATEVPGLLRQQVVHRRVEQRLDQDRRRSTTAGDRGHQRQPDAVGSTFKRPMDMEFGPDGALYVIEWGSGFNGDNADSGVYRIDYIEGDGTPIAHATADTDHGPAPLTVQFSSAGSVDPEGTSLTYAWDFDGNGTTDSTAANPTHTYTTAGTYNAKLTVTDQARHDRLANVPITAGNTAPDGHDRLPAGRPVRRLRRHGRRTRSRSPTPRTARSTAPRSR